MIDIVLECHLRNVVSGNRAPTKGKGPEEGTHIQNWPASSFDVNDILIVCCDNALLKYFTITVDKWLKHGDTYCTFFFYIIKLKIRNY